MTQAQEPRKRIITTRHSYQSREQLNRYIDLYLSIGYERLKGFRVPTGTKHKLLLNYNRLRVILFHR